MWYNIDYKKLAVLMLPNFLRKPVLVAFIQSLLTPIANLHDEWLQKRLTNLYKLQHTGQVCFLRKVLNDRFDPQLRRIIIGDGNQFKRKYIYTHAENKPRFLGRLFLHLRTDYTDTGVDFIVFVPASIVANQPYEIEALINFYKEGVKRYKIVKI